VSKTGARKWVFRYSFDKKVRETGLGSANLVTLAEARDKAHAARKLIAAGINHHRQAGRQAAQRFPLHIRLLRGSVLVTKFGEGRNEKHRQQWAITLRYAAPNGITPLTR